MQIFGIVRWRSMSDDERNNTVEGIKKEIDEYTKQYKYIYIHSISNHEHGAVISLNIYQTDSIYWKNRPVIPTIISIGQTDEEARLTDS